MSQTVRLRIIVRDPVPGVDLRLQKGRNELVAPTEVTADSATFDFELEVEVRQDGTAGFRGPAAQGPPKGRFVYINSGTYAGQADSPWGRRAKIPLTELRGSLVLKALRRPGSMIVCTIDGRGKDGGPAAATMPLLDDDWHLDLPNTPALDPHTP
jgi:hypothetical protein